MLLFRAPQITDQYFAGVQADPTGTGNHFPATIANRRAASRSKNKTNTAEARLLIILSMLNYIENIMKYCLIFTFACGLLFAQVPPTTDVPDDAVVAKVDGMPVTAGEIRKSLMIMPKEFVQLFNQNPKYAVQQLFMLRYLADEAERTKLGDESPIKEQLQFLRANAMASAMVSHEHNFYKVTDDMVKEFYERNQTRYQQAKIKVIYVAFKPTAPLVGVVPQNQSLEDVARSLSEAAVSKIQRSEADARKLAEDLVKQIRGGADFSKLVAEYSEDPASKAAGGDFGVVNTNSSYSDDVKKAVLALNEGEVTDPLRQASAFYIIRVEKKTNQPMDELRGAIGDEIRQNHLNDWLSSVGKKFEPQVENVQFFTQTKMPVPGAPAAPAPPAK
jgi:foldase protein PrsA